MSDVFCQRYQKTMPGLSKPPFPGNDGDYIFKNLSAQAWREWIDEQTRLINEQKLNPLDIETRNYLRKQLFLYINNEPFEKATGHK